MTSLAMSQTKLTGGRSSVSGITATVFGASGFLGKYVVNQLGKIGSRVIVPHRGDEVDVRHLKLAGDLGMMHCYKSSIRSVDDIKEAVEGSNVVINLLGKHYETMRWSFADVHGAFPGVLAQLCADSGVERLVHVSALGAYHDSPSAFSRSKALGEEAVREAFPQATILRPATIFGDEDKFLNRIAKLSTTMPFYPMVDATTTKQQPVFMNDVADAIFKAATDPSAMGKTFELAGPKVYSNKEIVDYVLHTIREENNAIDLPRPVGYAVGSAMGMIPNPWMSLEGMRRQSVDLVQPESDVLTFDDLDIGKKLTAIEDVAERYLVRFRKMSVFVEDGEVINQPR